MLMSRKFRCLPLAAVLLFACAPQPMGQPVVVASPGAAGTSPPPSSAPGPAASTLVPVIAASPTTGPSQIAVTSSNHLAPAVGETVMLRAFIPYPQAAATGARWALDPGDEAKATLLPAGDGATCQVVVRQPGAIRVTVSLGTVSAHAILAATTAPPPGKLVAVPGLEQSYPGPFEFNNVPVVITSEAAWTRYWQGVAAFTAQQHGGGNFSVPALPAVDLATSSLVVIGSTNGSPRPLPVLTRVEPEGEGLVEVDLPDEENYAPGPAVVQRALQVYQVAKLPATTRVVYDCRAAYSCGPAQPLPSPAPFAAVAAQVLTVGQAVNLPAQGQGVPLKWALAPRTAARATLDGNNLLPTAPGALVLTVTDGVETVTVVEAVAARADLERSLNDYRTIRLDGGPRLFRTAEEWSSFWTQNFYPPGTGADQPWTAPPPPPPAPQVAFPDRNVLAVPMTSSVKPAITAIDGATVTLTQPGVIRGGSFTPMGAQTGPTAFYDVPAIAGTPTVTVEAVPEEAAP
jgi:hypothetical protein